MPTASSLAWKDFSPKSQDAVALQQIKERGALPMIDRGDIRQAIDRCSNIWASLPGAGYGQFEHKAGQPDCKIQRSWRKRSERLDVWADTAIISALAICIIVCLSRVTITMMPLPTKPSGCTKCQRTEAGERGNYWHADASAWCCCKPDAKYTKELADAAGNDALRDDVAAGRRRLHISSLSVSAWSHHRLRRIMQPPPDWQTLLNGIISPSERGWSVQKQLEANPEVY